MVCDGPAVEVNGGVGGVVEFDPFVGAVRAGWMVHDFIDENIAGVCRVAYRAEMYNRQQDDECGRQPPDCCWLMHLWLPPLRGRLGFEPRYADLQSAT